MKYRAIHFLPLFSVIAAFMSLTARTAHALTVREGMRYTANFTVDDILKPIIDFFKALLDFILAPFKAIGDVFSSWGKGLYDAVGVWAPLVAIFVVGLSLFILYLFLKFRRMIPAGD